MKPKARQTSLHVKPELRTRLRGVPTAINEANGIRAGVLGHLIYGSKQRLVGFAPHCKHAQTCRNRK